MLPTLKEFGQMLLTFTFVTFAWIFFRAASLTEAVAYIKNFVFGIPQLLGGDKAFIGTKFLVFIIPLLISDWFLRYDERRLIIPRKMRYLIYCFFIISVFYMIIRTKENSFIYFQF
jgi:hypothetical protein